MKRIALALVALALVFGGCHREYHPAGEDSGHSHGEEGTEEEAPAFTVWSANHELYAETNQPHAGEALTILAHITDIRDGHVPVRDARVTVSHLLGGEPLQQADGVLVEPGIYSFTTGPLETAEGDLLFSIRAGAMSDSLLVPHFHGDHGHDHGHSHEQEPVGGITFTKEQAWTTRFRVDPVARGTFWEVIGTSGEMLAMPGEKQNIVAKTGGMVLFTSRNLVQGSPVKKGDLLFAISGTGLADNNVTVKFNEARTNFLLSRQNYERQRKLFREKVVSERQFRESESRYVNDSVAYHSLAGSMSNEGMNVFAPLTGYLHELNVSEGQYVTTGQKLATLSANRIMLLRADLPQLHYASLSSITTTTFRPAYTAKVYTLEELQGRLLARGASVAENDHYMPVYFEVTNDGTLLEGAYAEFFLRTAPRPGVVTVPVASLVEEQNEYYVYVQEGGEAFRKRYVQIGASDGLRVEIISGLAPGERIVTEGTMLVKAASISSAPSHGHQH